MAGQASGEKPPRATSHAQKFRESEKEKKKKEQDGRLDKKTFSFQNSHKFNLQFGILFFFYSFAS